ncbi:unnamed protein product [Cuscuta epithymum]|uniref:Polyphenol oxidase C-terminal domain-containing protein n=1 Tax=Cuscuta epithymum TaxID=186058 RepID=A0AAV0F637_9ASTE|nr:unnamed protein product [Cuscuta epithymum]
MISIVYIQELKTSEYTKKHTLRIYYHKHVQLFVIHLICRLISFLLLLFMDMPTQWMRSRPTSKKKTQSARSTKISIPLAINILPTTLQQTVTFYVMRPKTSRSKQEKADMEELLNLNLTYDETKYIRFDVFLNEDNLLKVFELDRAEYLGSFANLAHIHENSNENQPKTTTYSLAITELLEDLGLELDKNVAVTVVPKYNGEFMTINSVDVSLLSC